MSKYGVLRNHDKELLDFTKEYLKEHYYVSSKALARTIQKCSQFDKTNRKLTTSFGQILGNLTNLGILERYNAFTYKKSINWILKLEESFEKRKKPKWMKM